MELIDVLEKLKNSEISITEAKKQILINNYECLSNIAKIDIHRAKRIGIPEAVLAEGKNPEDLVNIARVHFKEEGRAIITRVSEVQRNQLERLSNELSVELKWNKHARAAVLRNHEVRKTGGRVGIISAGTADMSVAEEAKVIAEEMGCEVTTIYDVGVAGIHRLFPELGMLVKNGIDAVVVAAGREGTLPTIVSGLVDVPVIGVPVSTGYGIGGKGEAALMSMLQSCSVIAVVNIDAGFIAGAFAARIANMVARERGREDGNEK